MFHVTFIKTVTKNKWHSVYATEQGLLKLVARVMFSDFWWFGSVTKRWKENYQKLATKGLRKTAVRIPVVSKIKTQLRSWKTCQISVKLRKCHKGSWLLGDINILPLRFLFLSSQSFCPCLVASLNPLLLLSFMTKFYNHLWHLKSCFFL